MKKVLLSICFLVLFIPAFSQLTLTTASVPVAGDVNIAYKANKTGVKTGPGGTSQTWNFSNLSIINNAITSTYVNPASTPYASSFPSSTICIKDGSTYFYYQLQGSNFLFLGFDAGGGFDMNFSNAQVQFTFPFTYTSVVNDNFTATILGGVIHRRGSVQVTGDGQGTLIMPSGTYNNVLRIKFVENFIDSASGYPNDTTRSESYQWFVNNKLFPVLRIDTATVNRKGYSKNVLVNSAYTGLKEELAESGDMSIWPNPAENNAVLSIRSKRGVSGKVSISNLLGQELKHETHLLLPGDNELPLEFSDLKRGIYFVRFDSDEFSLQRKIILR
jgi:hypothetical protein